MTPLTPVKLSHHRNGISGNPFTVGIVKTEVISGMGEEEFLVIQFDNLPTFTAVLGMDKLKEGIIEFGKNSWRGDEFADEFKELVENA